MERLLSHQPPQFSLVLLNGGLTHNKLDDSGLKFALSSLRMLTTPPAYHPQRNVNKAGGRVFQRIRDKIDTNPFPRAAGDMKHPVRTQCVGDVQNQGCRVVGFGAVGVLRLLAPLVEPEAGRAHSVFRERAQVEGGLYILVGEVLIRRSCRAVLGR